MYEWIGKFAANPSLRLKLSACIRRIPLWCSAPVCRFAGLVLFICMHDIRRTIRTNMTKANLFRNSPYARFRSFVTAAQYFLQAAFTMYELFLEAENLPHLHHERTKCTDYVRRRFCFEGESHLADALRSGKGAIVYAPHVGNFLYYYWAISNQTNCLAVATASNQELNFLYLTFQNKGCRGLDYDMTPPGELLGALKRHLNQGGVIYLLGDFWRPTFPTSTLFGLPNRSPVGAALLALNTEAPIIPFHGYRVKSFRHRLVFDAPLNLQEIRRNKHKAFTAQRLSDVLESMIVRTPSQWFYWFNVHERWHSTNKRRDAI